MIFLPPSLDTLPMAKKKQAKKKPVFDSGYMQRLGKKGGVKTRRKMLKRDKNYYSRIARMSHPKNNPNAKRGEYVGGRPKNAVDDSK